MSVLLSESDFFIRAIRLSRAINPRSGVTLKVTLAAPSGGSSSQVTLGIVAADAVTGITKLNESAKTITYELSATSAAGVVASDSRTVTLTLVAGT